MAIQDVDEVVEILGRMGPDAEDIVQVPEVDQGGSPIPPYRC